VDRLADALVAMQRLFTGSSTSPLLADLREAADGLRQHYVRIVGTVLREVDACCFTDVADAERYASWQAMDAFASELVRLQATVFTLITTRCSCRRSLSTGWPTTASVSGRRHDVFSLKTCR
jgi:hypothetical protein